MAVDAPTVALEPTVTRKSFLYTFRKKRIATTNHSTLIRSATICLEAQRILSSRLISGLTVPWCPYQLLLNYCHLRSYLAATVAIASSSSSWVSICILYSSQSLQSSMERKEGWHFCLEVCEFGYQAASHRLYQYPFASLTTFMSFLCWLDLLHESLYLHFCL